MSNDHCTESTIEYSIWYYNMIYIRAKSTELTMKFRMFAVLMTDVEDFVEEQKTIELSNINIASIFCLLQVLQESKHVI